jgi:hypothetical protein
MLKRNSKAITLHVEGRDLVDVIEKAVSFDRETCRWTILGEAAEIQRSNERTRVLAALADVPGGLAVSEIQGSAQLASRGAADKLLARMLQDGEVSRAAVGRYCLPQYMRETRETGEGDQKYGETPANDHTSDLSPASPASPTQREIPHTSAIEFLRWALKPGPRLVQDIEASARAEGLLGEHQRINNAGSLQFAKKELGVVIDREGFGPGSKVYWRLPDVIPESD